MQRQQKIYSFLCALFVVCIIVSNLVFKKFITLNLYFLPAIDLSVGVLFYPVTFLLTDIVTETYGKKYADHMIHCAMIIAVVIVILVKLLDLLPAALWSPVDDNMFTIVFGSINIAVFSSIIASYISQLLDVRLFLFFKRKTSGKFLWLRNNCSTMLSQIVDTVLVLSLLCLANIIPWQQFYILCFNSLLFKFSFAILDTPFCYIGVRLLRASTIKDS